jgi:hypothetical protein
MQKTKELYDYLKINDSKYDYESSSTATLMITHGMIMNVRP